MKKNFLSGLPLLLPILLTTAIVLFVINAITRPFQNLAEGLLQSSHLFATSIQDSPFLTIVITKALILLLLFAFILIIGMLGAHYLLAPLLEFGDRLISRIPYVNKIYKTSQEVIKSFFYSSEASFTQVVLAPFPQEGRLGVGFITCPAVAVSNLENETVHYVSVFVPGTPNPTAGYLLLYKAEELTWSKMQVDEGMKIVVSCGTSIPETFFTSHASKPAQKRDILHCP